MDGYSPNQEQEIQDMLQRAKKSPDRHGRLRQDALRRLINLAHSDSAALKILAAGNMRFFLTDFPDLEEAAIDTIYDLCEDSSSEVRLQGYLAITEVSRMQSRWIKRNADVLVQLLQSEEVDEVAVVKKALVDHLSMDPKITLGVLCDQITPRDDTTDEEEISIRKHLRSLVLQFMAGEAKQSICEHHVGAGDIEEQLLYEGLFAAIPRLGLDDLQLLLNDLMYALPAFASQKPSERGSELLQLLLAEKILPALKEDLQSDSKVLSTTRPILQICEHLSCILQAVPAVDLLQFFCASLIGKITLQKMQVIDQQWIVCSLARVLRVAEKQAPSPRFSALRRAIIDACPYLLEVFKKSKASHSEVEITYRTFLEACLERTRELSWTPPPLLLKVLTGFQKRPEVAQNIDCEKMIRSLDPIHRPSTPNTSALQINAAKTAPSVGMSFTPGASGLQNVGSISNLSRPVSAVQDRTKRDIGLESSMRPPKRTKVEEVTSSPKVPTLLSRLGTTINRQSPLSESLSRTPTASPIPDDKASSQATQGFSIKGAATKQASHNVSVSSRVAPFTLLERLQDSDTGDYSVTHQQNVGGKRRIV